MDRRERTGSPQVAMMAALAGERATIWTALPGIVQSFNAAKQTCVVQPSLQALVTGFDGTKSWVSLPLLVDCPVFFPTGGGCTLTFPVSAGDEALVVFASRCIDAWWQSGGIQVQAEMRMHDLSDGFAFVGVSSVPNVIPAISTAAAQLRTDDGTTFVEVSATGVKTQTTGNAAVVAGGVASVTAPVINLTGAVNIVGVFTINGAPYAAHTHSGVQPGAGNTGAIT
jgi:Phage protein Gp138 N-terminal domain/GpV Apex motif